MERTTSRGARARTLISVLPNWADSQPFPPITANAPAHGRSGHILLAAAAALLQLEIDVIKTYESALEPLVEPLVREHLARIKADSRTYRLGTSWRGSRLRLWSHLRMGQKPQRIAACLAALLSTKGLSLPRLRGDAGA